MKKRALGAGRIGQHIVIGVLASWVFVALGAPVLAPHSPRDQNLEARFLPILAEGHPLGTDSLGRDVLSRLLFGARAALVVGFGTIGIALGLGTVLGVLGLRRALHRMISPIMDSVLAVPTILLSLTIIAAFGPGQTQVVFSLGIVFTPLFYRVVRSQVLRASAEGWVEVARVIGTPPARTIFRHILPQVVPSIFIQGTSLFSLAISLEASLSFLGFGAQPPETSWGLMLQDARDYLLTAWYLAIPPGVFLAIVVLCLNLLGDMVAEKTRT